MNTNLIKGRIRHHELERKQLQFDHDELIREAQKAQAIFQEKVTLNQNRYQQLTGAIAELTELLKHELPDMRSPDGQPSTSPDRIPGIGHRAGDHLGPPVVHRKLDPPYTSTGKISVGDNPPDPGDPVGIAEFHRP